ncbi:MAG: Flagellar hook-associated protein 2 [Ilumatobacteraceae bacterium]|nr:Flagellar hook-associated protein 2 [Ilumatobacteraceae bacterium]
MVGTIDTDSLITQMMAVEQKPQDLLKTQITALQTQQNAWQAIADKLTALQTASDAMTSLGALSAMRTVSSTDSGSVAVTSTGAGSATSASVEVLGLAAAQSVLVSDTFTGSTDLANGRTLTIANNATGATQTFSSADGTIGGLATAINAAGAGVSARVLQTSPGQYQLTLTATTTGTASAFTATGSGFGTFTTQRNATDASFKVDGITLTRSSNIVTDAIDGVSMTLQQVTAAPVVVSSAQDTTGIIAKVQAMVDAANAVGTVIDAATAIGADSTSGGPLAGDYSARNIMSSIRDGIASSLITASGKTITANTLGVSLNKDGTIAFDSSALTATLATSADDALSALGRSVASTATGVSVIGTLSTATAGTHTISVTQAASQSSMVGLPVTLPPAGTSIAMQIITTNGTANINFNVGSTWSQTAGNLNAALRIAGARVSAVPQTVGGVDQGLTLTSDRYGSGQTFTVSGATALGIDGSSTGGTDAAGTIDGTAFTASGQTATSNGLVLSVTTTADQLAALGGTSNGTFSMNQGLAGLLSIVGARGGTDGPVLASKATAAQQATDLQARVDEWTTTLAQTEDTLRAKFTAMQVALDQLNAMQSQLSQLSTSSG